MKKSILYIVGFFCASVLILNLLFSGPTTRVNANNSSSDAPTTNNSQENEAAAVFLACRIAFEKSFPKQNIVSWDPENKHMLIEIWPNDFGAEEANYALTDIKYLNQWRAMVSTLGELSSDIEAKLNDAGVQSPTVEINWYDPIDNDLLLASLINGDLQYDAVDATPAGEQIEGKTS